MTTYSAITYEVSDKIARITLNRPRYRNAQSQKMLQELDHAIIAANADHAVHVITLFGAGEDFSSGHDLGTADEAEYRVRFPDEAGMRGTFARSWRNYPDTHLRWRNIGKPTIAAVQGYCIYGGWMVASTMDIIYAADDAKFIGGLFQYFSIPWDIHPRRAKELLFEGRVLTADEAKELGFVNRVFPRELLVEATLAYAAEVAKNDPFEMRMTKLAINQAQDAQGFTGHIHSAHSMFHVSLVGEKDPDFALGRFLPKRRPMAAIALERRRRASGGAN